MKHWNKLRCHTAQNQARHWFTRLQLPVWLTVECRQFTGGSRQPSWDGCRDPSSWDAPACERRPNTPWTCCDTEANQDWAAIHCRPTHDSSHHTPGSTHNRPHTHIHVDIQAHIHQDWTAIHCQPTHDSSHHVPGSTQNRPHTDLWLYLCCKLLLFTHRPTTKCEPTV